MTVVKDSGARATLPPFGEEHEELRETVRALRRQGDRAQRRRVGGGARIPARALRPLRRARLPRPQVPRGATAARAAPTCTTRSGSRSWPARAAPAASPPGSTPTPRSRCRRSSTSAPRSRSSAGWCRGSPARRSARSGSPSPAPAPTSPASRTTAERVDGGYVVNGAKTFITNGVRADFLVCACKTTRGGRPRRHLLPRPRARDARLRGRAQAGEDGLALLRHRRALLHRRRGARPRTCSARRTAASS